MIKKKTISWRHESAWHLIKIFTRFVAHPTQHKNAFCCAVFHCRRHRKKRTAMIKRWTEQKREFGKSWENPIKNSFLPTTQKTISHGFCVQFWVIKVEHFMVYPFFRTFLFYRLFTFIFNLLDPRRKRKSCEIFLDENFFYLIYRLM